MTIAQVVAAACGLETQKHGNQTRFRLVDLISHRGEPPGNGTSSTGTPTEQSQKVAPETELLEQENQFLRRRIEELEVDREERKQREERLQGIIERQTLALPSPERRGLVARFVQWVRT